MNTVVTSANKSEDMTDFVRRLRPKRWKVFQMLPLEGENVGSNATQRNAWGLEVTPVYFGRIENQGSSFL